MNAAEPEARANPLAGRPVATVRVLEGVERDWGLGLARLDPATQESLHLKEGGILEIIGKRRTAVRLGPADPKAEPGVLLADGLIRRNVGAGLGDEVTVRPVDSARADRLILAPVHVPGLPASMGQKVQATVKQVLQDRILAAGDMFIVPGVGILGAATLFMVQQTVPDRIVQVSSETAIVVTDEPVNEDGTAWTSAGAEMATLRQKLETAQREGLYLRAEVENVRKAAERERDDFHRRAAESVFERILPTLDELEAAIAALPEEHAKGVALVRDNLLRSLAEIGLHPIPSEGARFDPYRHEAVDVVTDSPLENGRVALVLRSGYLYGSKVLRPTLVAVVKKGERDA